jgi:two-component system chemotaxis response regulator CheB
MLHHDIVTIGASAGGVEALTRIVSRLPPDFPAACFVVLHIPSETTSVLPAILNRSGPLHASHPFDGERIEMSRIYVAPPDRHLLLKHGFISLVNGPRENRHRPAIDPLFRTAARAYASRVTGVILTGAGDDGVAGLRAIKNRGGVAIVQDPAEAAIPELPRSALEFVDVDHVVSIDELTLLLNEIVRRPAEAHSPPPSLALDKESRIAEADLTVIEDEKKVGIPSAFSCPDCGGVLWELEEGDFLRFRCRVGHAYSARALGEEQNDSLEKGLWAAFRALEEKASFARRLSVRARGSGNTALATRFLDQAEEASASADAIRQMILRLESAVELEATNE